MENKGLNAMSVVVCLGARREITFFAECRFFRPTNSNSHASITLDGKKRKNPRAFFQHQFGVIW